LKQCTDILHAATVKIAPLMQENMVKYTKSAGPENSSGSISKGIQSALTLASTYTGTVQGVAAKEGGAERGDEDEGSGDRDEDDPFGLKGLLKVFNTAEMCVNYTDRLSRDIAKAGETVFSAPPVGDMRNRPPFASHFHPFLLFNIPHFAFFELEAPYWLDRTLRLTTYRNFSFCLYSNRCWSRHAAGQSTGVEGRQTLFRSVPRDGQAEDLQGGLRGLQTVLPAGESLWRWDYQGYVLT
jgi:hypothetical protein